MMVNKFELFRKKLEQYRFCTFISEGAYNGLIEEFDDLFPKESDNENT